MSVETGIIRISDGSVRIYLSELAETIKPDDIMEYIEKNLKIDVYRKTTQGTHYTKYGSIREYKKLYEDDYFIIYERPVKEIQGERVDVVGEDQEQ